MIKPPSNQKTWDAFYTGDTAIIQLPDEASDEQKKDRDDLIERARELGADGWADVVVEGERPTIFTFKPLGSELTGHLVDMLNDPRVGAFRVFALAFRLALVGVKNLTDSGKVDFVNHGEFGRIATTAFLDRAGCTGEVGASIITELGSLVMTRARAANPKS